VPRRREWLPQFNWPVFGPLIVVIALVVGISGLVVGLLAGGGEADRSLATGGGYDLRPPELVRAQVFSLSARVIGSPTIRRGPGTQYPAVGRATDGQELHVIACSPDCAWLRVFTLTDEGQWWLPAVFLSVSGRLEDLPVLTPVEAPGR
jgi:hypothetical protein